MAKRGPKAAQTLLTVVNGRKEGGVVDDTTRSIEVPIPGEELMLTPAEVQVWQEQLGACPQGMLRRIDLGLFLVYVRAIVQHRTAFAHINQHGAVLTTKRGEIITNPYVRIADMQAAIIAKVSKELGFSPRGRASIKITQGIAPPVGNKFARNGIHRGA